MILVDVNLLIYAYDANSRHHKAAREWIDGQFTGSMPIGLPWETISAFLRIVTNPRVYERPVLITEAWRQVREWLDLDSA